MNDENITKTPEMTDNRDGFDERTYNLPRIYHAFMDFWSSYAHPPGQEYQKWGNYHANKAWKKLTETLTLDIIVWGDWATWQLPRRSNASDSVT